MSKETSDLVRSIEVGRKFVVVSKLPDWAQLPAPCRSVVKCRVQDKTRLTLGTVHKFKIISGFDKHQTTRYEERLDSETLDFLILPGTIYSIFTDRTFIVSEVIQLSTNERPAHLVQLRFHTGGVVSVRAYNSGHARIVGTGDNMTIIRPSTIADSFAPSGPVQFNRKR